MTAPLALEAGPDPLLGKVLADRYRVVRKLGEGGMGAVYEGEHLVIKKRVAIKVLHAQYATSADIVARFHQEALAATAIGHEHIVEVNDMGRTPEGAIFMVLELLAGQDFAHLIEREGRLSIGRTVHIVAQVCEGVQAAHDKGIVHRDLKPENVFLLKRGGDPDFAKVLDFGISKIQGGGESGARAATKTGSIMGTAYYMSPEQAQGKKSVDGRTDVWALGVILHRALTGHYPFEDESYPMLIVRICTDAPPPLRSLRPDVPAALEAIVLRCLERDVDRRMPSCAELRAAILPFVAQTSPPPSMAKAAFDATMPAQMATPAMRAVSGVRETAPLGTAKTASAETGVAPSGAPRWLPATALAIVTSLVVGGGVWMSTRQEQAPPTMTPDTTPPTSVADVTPPAEPPPPGAELEFIVSPSEAVVLIDGRPVASASGEVRVPVSADDTAIHELRVEARGFRSRVEDLRLSYAQRVVVALDPGTGTDDRRASHTGTGVAHREHPATTEPRASVVASGRAGSSGSGTRTIGGAEGPSGVGATTPPTTPPTPTSVTPPPPETHAPTIEGVVAPPPRALLKHVPIP